MTPTARNWINRLIRLVLFALIIFLISRDLARSISRVDWHGLRVEWWLLAASVLAMLVSMFFTAESNRSLLALVAPPAPRANLFSVIWISRLGKYIPGKVASIAGAAVMLRPYGVPMVAGTSVVTLNTLLTVVIGFIVAAPLLLFQPVIRQHVPLAGVWTALAIAAGAVFVHPRVSFPLMDFASRRITGKPLAVRPNLVHYAPSVACILGQWCLSGLSLWLAARAISPRFEPAQVGLCISLTALAVTLGFVVLFAPGGLGVREWVYLAMLTPVLGPDAALVTVGMRIIYTGSEALLAAAGVVVLRLRPAPRRDPPTEQSSVQPGESA